MLQIIDQFGRKRQTTNFYKTSPKLICFSRTVGSQKFGQYIRITYVMHRMVSFERYCKQMYFFKNPIDLLVRIHFLGILSGKGASCHLPQTRYQGVGKQFGRKCCSSLISSTYSLKRTLLQFNVTSNTNQAVKSLFFIGKCFLTESYL